VSGSVRESSPRNERLGVGLRQPAGILATSEPIAASSRLMTAAERLPPPPRCSVGHDLGRGVNFAPIRIEDTHRDGVRRPINLGHKRDGAGDASCVGAPFPKDVGRIVKELDSVLHVPSSRRSVATLEHPRDRY
jgi:hypothetical protein